MNKTITIDKKEYEFDFIYDEVNAKLATDAYHLQNDAYLSSYKNNTTRTITTTILTVSFLIISVILFFIKALFGVILGGATIIATLIAGTIIIFNYFENEKMKPEEENFERIFYEKTKNCKIDKITFKRPHGTYYVIVEVSTIDNNGNVSRFDIFMNKKENVNAEKIVINIAENTFTFPYNEQKIT